MLLWMVVTPEPASWCTLVLRVATPNSWPLITPIMLPRLPRGSPVWKEKGGSDTVTGALSTPHAPDASRSRGSSHRVGSERRPSTVKQRAQGHTASKGQANAQGTQAPVGGGPGRGRDDGQLLRLALPLVPQATPEMAYQLQSWRRGHRLAKTHWLRPGAHEGGGWPTGGAGAPSQGVHCHRTFPIPSVASVAGSSRPAAGLAGQGGRRCVSRGSLVLI